MTQSISPPLVFLLAALLLFALAYAWRSRTRTVMQRAECEALRAALAQKEGELARKQDALARTLERCDELEAELSGLHEKLGQEETQIEQLRDLVKVHVARRREFDEWANPIRASLGEAFGHTLRRLKEQIERQEFALRRQERLVSEAESQYRSKQDELERMRRELTLKNYHIAALNERFIRVEERMQDLSSQVATLGLGRGPRGEAEPVAVPAGGAPVSPDTERFSGDKPESRDWMEVLDNWHKQLHERLDRMDELQAQLRGTGARPGSTRQTPTGRPGEAGAV